MKKKKNKKAKGTTTEARVPMTVHPHLSMFMIVALATGKVKPEGSKTEEKFTYGHTTGASPVLLYRGRYATLDAQAFVKHAVDAIDAQLAKEAEKGQPTS